jgi:hypothetical protein
MTRKLPVPPKPNRATSVSSLLPPSFRLRPAGFKVPGALKAPLWSDSESGCWPLRQCTLADSPVAGPPAAAAPICPGMDGSRLNLKFLAAGGNELGAWSGSRKKIRQIENRAPPCQCAARAPFKSAASGFKVYKFKVAIAA